MVRYFFDLSSADDFLRDEEGVDLPSAESVHDMAIDLLFDAAREGVVEGSIGQRIAIEVRNGIGSVLELVAVFDSRISKASL